MKWYIYTVGKPALAYAKTGVAEYLKRLRRYTSCEHRLMKRGDSKEITSLINSQREGGIAIVLDERGQILTTEDLVAKVEHWHHEAVKSVRLFIGGADGHNDEIRQQADLVLGLSGFTLQHELALVVLVEQIYRVHTILRGEPYHR